MDSQDVRLLLWHDLSDMQPVALSEMPIKYLENPNGRAFYMLKTFTLKQFDVMRRDAFKLMANKGTRTEGAKNLLRYATYFTAGGMSSQALKDFIMGREYDVSDAFVDNMWKMIGFNKYGAEKLANTGVKGITEAGINLVSVPTGPYINMLDDALNYSQYYLGIDKKNEAENKTIKSVPIAGSVVYQYFFEGIEKDKERKKKEDKKKKQRQRNFKRQMNRLF